LPGNSNMPFRSDYGEEKPLLVIFHDPPETIGIHDPNSSRLESHNIIVVRF
jgi:Arb2 domain